MGGVSHPAKFSDEIIASVRTLLLTQHALPGGRVLDPFAGTGRIHQLQDGGHDARLGVQTVGVELEPEWATMHPRTIQGDATRLPFPDESFGGVITSPCYGNRMADTYLGDEKGSTRYTYTTALGRRLHPQNAGAMQWGDRYRQLHTEAWREAARVLQSGGLFLLNISDHIRAGKVVPVSAWHLQALIPLGFDWFAAYPIRTRRQKHGQNGERRVGVEWLHVLKKV